MPDEDNPLANFKRRGRRDADAARRDAERAAGLGVEPPPHHDEGERRSPNKRPTTFTITPQHVARLDALAFDASAPDDRVSRSAVLSALLDAVLDAEAAGAEIPPDPYDLRAWVAARLAPPAGE
jgi:hypothetical protein